MCHLLCCSSSLQGGWVGLEEFRGPSQSKLVSDSGTVECSVVNGTETEGFMQSKSQSPCSRQS